MCCQPLHTHRCTLHHPILCTQRTHMPVLQCRSQHIICYHFSTHNQLVFVSTFVCCVCAHIDVGLCPMPNIRVSHSADAILQTDPQTRVSWTTLANVQLSCVSFCNKSERRKKHFFNFAQTNVSWTPMCANVSFSCVWFCNSEHRKKPTTNT